MSEAIRIFVGCAANNEDLESQAVLHYTLEKFASKPVQIEWMQQSKDPASFWSGWNTAGWVTPFSGFRWGIPARCGFEGRGIYMDSDMMVRDDIAKLWDAPLNPAAAIISKGTNKRYCVMLMDNAKLKAHAPPIETLKRQPGAFRSFRDRMSNTTGLVQPFGALGNWNCCDGESYKTLDHPDIKCIHYTAIDTQPQLRHALPRLQKAGQQHWFKGRPRPHWRKDIPELFDRLLNEAIIAGYEPRKYTIGGLGAYQAGGSAGGRWNNPTAREEAARGV